jgi:hypothetical protein
VTTLATYAVETDSNYLGRVRFALDSQHSTVTFDLRPVPLKHVLSLSDPLAKSVELLIRVASLQRDFKKNLTTNETFWIKPLDQVKVDVFQALHPMTNNGHLSTSVDGVALSSAEASIAALQDAIMEFSRRNGLDIESTRDTEYFTVHVVVSDLAARVRYVPYLAFVKSRHGIPIENEWIDVGRGEHDLSLIGKYQFVVEWPPSLGGFETNDYYFQKDTALQFAPGRKQQ